MLRGRIAAYNMHLRGIADDHGCDLVDLWSMRVLNDTRAWSPDRLHLTAEGHRRVALRACEVLGVPVTEDWRAPLPPPVAAPRGTLARGPMRARGTMRARRKRAPGGGPRGQRRRDELARWPRAARTPAGPREYAMPWVRRRLSGASSGDGLSPSAPTWCPCQRPGPPRAAAKSAVPSPAGSPGEVGQDLF